MNTLRITLLATATFLAACSGQPDQAPSADETPSDESTNAANGEETTGSATTGTEETGAETERATPASYPDGIAGTVLETMNSGGYTYVQIDTGSGKPWAAVPQVAVAVGDKVKVQPGMAMENYTSKTLGRTFDVVYFSGGLASTAAVAIPAGPTAGTGSTRAPTGTGADFTGISPVEGGQTVAEVFAGKDTLAGNEVAIRGKVVKFTGGILGTNFLHLQDGTGGPGTNDLTVTSKTVVSVGATVVVRGILVANKDFGAGYRYDLIVEDAALTVE